jgi:hypothetical protein
VGDRGGMACLADETWEQPGLGWRWIGSIDVSINKAFTARAFDVSTAQLSENSQPGQQFYGIQNSNHGADHDLRWRRSLATQRASRRRHRHQRRQRQPGSSGRDIRRFGHSRLRGGVASAFAFAFISRSATLVPNRKNARFASLWVMPENRHICDVLCGAPSLGPWRS